MNDEIVKMATNVPRIEDAIRKHGSANYFMKTDAVAAYHQLCLSEELRAILAVWTPYRHYCTRTKKSGQPKQNQVTFYASGLEV